MVQGEQALTLILAVAPLPAGDSLTFLDGVERVLDGWAGEFGTSGEWLLRLILAAVLGGIIGTEREVSGHAAGLRTFMLVAAGSALAMVVSQAVAYGDWTAIAGQHTGFVVSVDPGRIAYGVMTGVGFLGAGTILRRGDRVRGLTTAAGIWSVAAVGLAAGLGLYVVSLIATALLMITLTVLNTIGKYLPSWETCRIRVNVAATPTCVEDFEQFVAAPGLRLEQVRLSRPQSGGSDRVQLDGNVIYFRTAHFRDLRRRLLENDQVRVERLG